MMTRQEWNKIVAAAIKQDATAFEIIVQKKMRSILFYTNNFIYHPGFAEDAAQEVVFRMYKTIGNLQAPEAFNVWMHRIILGTCSRINKKFPSNSYVEDLVEIPTETKTNMLPQSAAEEQDEREHVIAAIHSLPPRQQLAITMFYYDELSYTEISQIMGISVSGVSSTIVKAKKALKASLSGVQAAEEDEKLHRLAMAVVLQQSFIQQSRLLASPSALEALANKAIRAARAQSCATGLKATNLGGGFLLSVASFSIAFAVLASGFQLFRPAPVPTINASIVMENNLPQIANHINPTFIEIQPVDFKGKITAWEVYNLHINKKIAGGTGTTLTKEQLIFPTGSYKITWTLEEDGQQSFVSRLFEIQ